MTNQTIEIMMKTVTTDFFESEKSYQGKQETLKQSLNGIWKFQYSVNAKKRPVSFYENGYDISEFDEIQVPQHIELAGYDKIHYINTMYPWEGHEYRRPAGTCNHIGEGMFSEALIIPQVLMSVFLIWRKLDRKKGDLKF